MIKSLSVYRQFLAIKPQDIFDSIAFNYAEKGQNKP